MTEDLRDRRRGSDRQMEELKDMISDLSNKVDAHIIKVTAYEPQLQELVSVLQKSKGIIWFVRVLIYLGTPVGAAIYFLKDHVKL